MLRSIKQQKKAIQSKKKAGGANVNIRRATSSLSLPNQKPDVVRSVPAAMGSMKVTGRPRATNHPNGDCEIVHREYLGDVSMAAAFSANSFPVNPGMSKTFPWLAAIAARYESYRFKKLRFCFETSCSSTQTGTVLLVPDYDAGDSAPTGKVQGLSYRNSARGQAWLSFCQDSSNEDLNKHKSFFIRSGALPANADIRLFDVANLFLCVQGSDTNVVGELWVEYDVLLMTPQINPDVLSGKLTGAGGGIGAASPFGAAPTTVGSIPITAILPNVIQFDSAFQGLAVLNLVGTTVIAPANTGSTVNIGATSSTTINAAATALQQFIEIVAQPGQRLVYDTSGSATISACVVRFAGYTQSNA